MCQRSTCFARGIFIDISRGILEERYQTSYHVRKSKNGNGLLFLCDFWLRYLKKLQFMLTETRQISNLRSQDVSKEILSDLVQKNVAEFSVKFFHFHCATPEKGTLNNYSKLKLRFFLISAHTFAMYCKNISHQYYATNQDTKPHILMQNCPKIGVDQCASFYICHSFFYYVAFFPLKGKLKYIIIHFQYEISNDIIVLSIQLLDIAPISPNCS